MNWLAHLLLSDPDPCSRIGSLLPDLLPARELREVPTDYQNGIRQHQRVDAFTDRHPVFKRSTRRVGPRWRRYGGIIIDVYYDHILTREWDRYSEAPMRAVIGEFHHSLEAHFPALPEPAVERLARIREEGLLETYGRIEGVRSALSGIGRRLRKPVPLDEALADLTPQHRELSADFAEFFPEAIAHLEQDGFR